ncbi:MAG: phage head-tail joining protein [Planctomycetota bacterium]|jgi:hypothetical protein
MAFTQVDLDAVRAAIAKGERSVQFADRSVTYRSMDELLRAEERIASALTTERPKQTFGVASKGF